MTFLLSLSRLRFLTATVAGVETTTSFSATKLHEPHSPQILRKRKEENEIISPVLLAVVCLFDERWIQRTAAAWPPGASLSYIAHAIWEKVGIEQQQPLEELREKERDFLRM